MSAPNTIIVAGNLTADPEYRTTSSEVHFVKLRMAVNRRVFVAESNSWEDRTDGFFTVNAWRDLGDNCARSLRRGDRIVVHGRLTHRQYEVTSQEGTENRQVTEIEADDIGASMRWHCWTRSEARPLNDVQPVPTGGPRPLSGDEDDEDDGDDETRTAEEDAEHGVAAAA
ncbi:hypothetical protein BH23ACT9_BH23ACT9_39890 [soil metagenome]